MGPMLDCACLQSPSQTLGNGGWPGATMDILSLLFIGWHPDDIFFRQLSVDMAELLIVFGTIAASLGLMVAFGNWWSR